MPLTFPNDRAVSINFGAPPCVFRVSKSLTETKPEAYSPQQVGLGPYHHLRPDLYTMQWKKVAAVAQYLDAERLKNIQQIVKALISADRLLFLRGCYDQYLDLGVLTIMWILVIDSIYLLQFLQNYRGMAKLVEDIFMLENQIPLGLLKDIRIMLQLSPSADRDHDLLETILALCREASPLELNLDEMEEIMELRKEHLLGVMYHLIVTNRGIQPRPRPRVGPRSMHENLERGVVFAAAAGVPGAEIVQNQIALVKSVPWANILWLCKKRDEQNPSDMVDEIDMPSVSELSKIAGIRFARTKGGIRGVKFDDGEGEKKFYLPQITLKSNSEVILRNLVAYETAISANTETIPELAKYVDLMCGIINTPKDVRILKTEKIIQSELEDEKIACIFNGIRKSSTGIIDDKKSISNIDTTIKKVKEGYGKIRRVRAHRSIKKCIYGSWKFLTVLSTVLVLGLLVLQAFCQIYGCAKRWSK